ncbi:hypothetical protein SLA2020_254710 [Shorea laevis]
MVALRSPSNFHNFPPCTCTNRGVFGVLEKISNLGQFSTISSSRYGKLKVKFPEQRHASLIKPTSFKYLKLLKMIGSCVPSPSVLTISVSLWQYPTVILLTCTRLWTVATETKFFILWQPHTNKVVRFLNDVVDVDN